MRLTLPLLHDKLTDTRTKVLNLTCAVLRGCWCLLLVGLLVGCGRPLQISPPSSEVELSPTSPISEATSPFLTASSVPGSAPLVQPTEGISTSGPVPSAAVLTPTLELTPTVVLVTSTDSAVPTPAVIVVPRTMVPQSNQQRWREQQQSRQVLEPPQIYIAKSPVTLWWYDPLTGQSVAIGTLVGEFPVQAMFIFRSEKRPALEVPYRINVDFGLTAISD